MTSHAEEPLPGGNVSQTTRKGDRVYRTAGPWTPAVQRLLAHLRAAGLDRVPEPFGVDERGREVLGYLPGTVPTYPMPEWVWSERTLIDAGRILRQVHDATVGYVDPEAQWRQPAREPAEVICLNDVAPYNMVFEHGRIIGMIDLDMASPGPRIWDAAYLAYRLVTLTSEANPDGALFDEATRISRLQTLIDAYGMAFAIGDVLRVVQERLEHLARFSEELAIETGRDVLRDHAALYRADAVYVEDLIRNL